MTADKMLRMWLRDNAADRRDRAIHARAAYTRGAIKDASHTLADAHAEAAAVYERALAKLAQP
jgi:hypothetical protein